MHRKKTDQPVTKHDKEDKEPWWNCMRSSLEKNKEKDKLIKPNVNICYLALWPSYLQNTYNNE
jgi:hypothetical protein